MKSNKLLIFTLVTIAVIIAATMMSRHRAPTTTMEKQLLFPELLEKVNDVSTIELTKQDTSLSLLKHNNQWVIKQADNYPADFGKIRETVIAVAELMILAEKTSNADRYEKLGVEKPSADGANSLLLSLLDDDGKALARLIVGKPRHSKSAEDKPGLYIRLPDAQQALLVEGRLDINADVKDWFKRELFSINAARIKRIQIAHADDSTVDLHRTADIDDFTMDNLPEGMEMRSNVIISRMGTMLEDIFVDNVIRDDKLAEAKQIVATIHTFDGLIITIISAKIGDKNFSGFSFSVDENVPAETGDKSEEEATNSDSDLPDSAKEEAATLNKLMSGWAFAIPGFKYELFTRTQKQLIEEIKPAEELSSEESSSANE